MKSGCTTMSDCWIIMSSCIIVWRIQDKNVDKYITIKFKRYQRLMTIEKEMLKSKMQEIKRL